MYLHTVSPADMGHTDCCPAALMHVLGESVEEAKKQPISQLVRGVRSASLRHSDCEPARPSGMM